MKNTDSKEVQDRQDRQAREEVARVFEAVERAHFRTDQDTGAAEHALVIWNAARKHAGLPYISKADLPKWDGTRYAMPKDSNLLTNKKKPVELLGKATRSPRGFGLVKFTDENEVECSLQESSNAVCENDDGSVDDPLGWLWLGVKSADPTVMKRHARDIGLELPPGEVSGWMPYPVPECVSFTTRMYLGEKQVRGLIARLNLWLETGSLLDE